MESDSGIPPAKRRRREEQLGPNIICQTGYSTSDFTVYSHAEREAFQCLELPGSRYFPPTSTYPDAAYTPSLLAEVPTYLNDSGVGDDNNSSHQADDETVCFGVISGLDGLCENPPSSGSSGPMLVQLDSPRSFIVKDGSGFRGTISELGPLVQELLREEALQLTAFCRIDSIKPIKTSRKYARIPCKIDITLCGPFGFFDDIGRWLEDNDVYLQDPRILTQDVKYCNPHRLSFSTWHTCPMVSQVVAQAAKTIYLRDITDGYDFLDSYFASQVEVEESEQPLSVVTPMKRHQKQALTFMLRREDGWAMLGPHKDLWTIRDSDHGRLFVNTISQECHQEPPPELYGGIIADPTGLGKTLTMIALAAMDHEIVGKRRGLADEVVEDSSKRIVAATLIVVPPSLLDTWEEQILQHVRPGSLRYRRHHGKTKLTSPSDVDLVHVVLTTFNSLSAEWRMSKEDAFGSVLFSVRWRRVVLDEAHTIRNEVSQRSKAICALHARSRWAVTATPIQNQLSDLATLLKFIRAHPYHEKRRFEEDITRYLKEEDPDQEGVRRLQRLSSCLLLRRPKKTIELPRRHDKECPVDFTDLERGTYNELKNRAILSIDEALQQGPDINRSGVYVNTLQQIESLRLFCDLGLHYHTRHEAKPSVVGSSSETSEWAAIAQQTFNYHLEMGSIICSLCHSAHNLMDMENLWDEPGTQQRRPLFSRCLRYVCVECASNLSRNGRTFQCGHNRACPAVPVSSSVHSFEDVSETVVEPQRLSSSLPSKVVALIADIQAQPFDVKCIVFSSWRLTLNIVEAGLNQVSIPCLRFDGKVPQSERQSVIERFKKDPSIRVLLLTLACGNFGLTLTEASRAYLMEPHWNPTIEEQAFGRIHRMGQTKEVTTVRFFIRDSFEEHVMDVQQSKKDLAGIILSPHDGGNSNNGIERLQKLRSLL